MTESGVGALVVASYVTTIDDHDLSGAAAARGDAPRLTRRRARDCATAALPPGVASTARGTDPRQAQRRAGEKL